MTIFITLLLRGAYPGHISDSDAFLSFVLYGLLFIVWLYSKFEKIISDKRESKRIGKQVEDYRKQLLTSGRTIEEVEK